ncbi:Trm112 family protein [Streptomyces sp. NPDC015131]|uniref:Trm112 family protein n=1 Tax=Streptomyces sp. NPDC015131 TaxID=3364941 RepID=UPI00370044C4
MRPDDPLLTILVCPLDKGPLLLAPGEPGAPGGSGPVLYNARLRRRYPVVDGVPRLLPSSGVPVTDEEHELILRRAGTPPGTDPSPPPAPPAPPAPRSPRS